MHNLNKLLKLLFLLLFTQGILQTIGIPIAIIKLCIEGLVIFMFFSNLKKLKTFFKLNLVLIIYILITIFSGLYNENDFWESVLYFRYHLYAYLIFVLAYSHDWSINQVTEQFNFLKKLLIVQVLYAFFELFILRNPQEEVVGTIFINGGELATILPLVGLCFLFVDYLFYKKKMNLVLSISLLLIGFASLKRGVIFYFPILIIILYVNFLSILGVHIAKKFLSISIVVLSVFTIFIFSVSKNISLKGDSLTSGISNSTSYAIKYSNAQSHDGYFIGRTSSSLQVIQKTGENGLKDVLGFGPSTLLGKSGDFFFYNIDYGIVGWSKEVISVGWLGMIFYFLLYFILIKKIQSKKEFFLRTILKKYYLMITSFYLVFLLCFFTYSPIFSNSGVVSFYFMLFAGILLNYFNQQNKYAKIK